MAALCAAISARQAGVSVLMVEAAPRELRGGNTRHSRNLRIMHAEPSAEIPGAYSEAEFMADLAKASDEVCDGALAAALVHKSAGLPSWIASHGVVFQTEHIPFSRKTAFLLGGGKAALNALYVAAARMDVRIVYGHSVEVRAVERWRRGAISCTLDHRVLRWRAGKHSILWIHQPGNALRQRRGFAFAAFARYRGGGKRRGGSSGGRRRPLFRP